MLKKSKTRQRFRELAFDLQFANSKEKENIFKEMLQMYKEEDDIEESKEMLKTLGINLDNIEYYE